MKTRQDGEFQIAGLDARPGLARGAGRAGAGRADGTALRWVGNVGSGLDDRSISELLRRLEPLKAKQPPIDPVPKMPRVPARMVTWVEPRLSARVKFAERTRDGRLRAPVFVGLAEERAAAGEAADPRGSR